MDNIENILDIVSPIIQTVCSIACLVIAINKENKENRRNDHPNPPIPHSTTNGDNNKSLNQRFREVLPFVVILIMTITSSVILLCHYISPEKQIDFWEYFAFGVSIVCLFVYGYKAYKSFDNYYILPPQWLWQSLFNKIPSHIHHANQLGFKFLVLKMDDSEEVNNAGERIKNNYQGHKDFQIDVKSAQEIDKIGDAGDYCGVIFLVGNNKHLKEVQEFMDAYSKQLNLPIAYIRLGKDHFKIKKYDRISKADFENCANHLVMRSYRRSEHWIKASKYSHWALWLVLAIAAIFLIAFANAKKEENIQKRAVKDKEQTIEAYNKSKEELNKRIIEQSYIFAEDRDEFYLSNTFIKLKEKSFDIKGLQRDNNFKEFVNSFAEFFFGEKLLIVAIQDIKIWLRNDEQDSIYCIYDKNADVLDNKPKGKGSMIGGIADKADIFVLWPGYNNNDPVWKDSKENTMAWKNDDHGDFEVCELRQDELGNNVGLKLKKDNGDKTKPIELNWYSKNSNTSESNGIALYGFSYQARLAIEIDLKPSEINKYKTIAVH